VVVPDDPGIRFDTLLYDGYAVPPFYDSLLGKLIVHAESREACLAKLVEVLARLEIRGIPTTVPLHAALARDPAVIAGEVHTRFLEAWLETSFAATGGVKEVA
jgi:acetyl-CoA carboxylase biotin carboxylase subunit